MRELLIWVRGRVHPALSQAAGSIALIAVWTTSSPGLACLNGVELHRKQAVQLANAAEKALADGDAKQALSMLADKMASPEGYELSHQGLRARLEQLFAVARFRAGGQADIDDAITVLRQQTKDSPKNPWLKVRLAEALSHNAKGTKEAVKILEPLAKEDLIVDAEGFATLARLRRQAGNAEGATAALERCKAMAKQPSLCSDAPLPPPPTVPRTKDPSALPDWR